MKLLGLEKTDKKITNRLIDILAIGIILVISFWNISKCDRIIIVDDEFGYWGVAAHIVGMDWSDMMSTTQYFAYGQSILLVPVLLLGKLGVPMSSLYKIVLVLNGIMVAGSYCLIVASLDKMYEYKNKTVSQFIALFTVLSIGNSTKILQTWPEISLFLVFWVTIFFLVSFIKKPGYKNLSLLIFFSVLVFAVHMRAIGITVSVVMVLTAFFLFSHEKKNYKMIVYGVILYACLILIALAIKNYANDNIYCAKDSINDFGGSASKFARVFCLTGIVDFFFSVIGKLYYSFIESFGLVLVGGIFFIKDLFDKEKNPEKSVVYVGLFGFLAFASEVVICAVAQFPHALESQGLVNVSDGFVYGRYQFFACSLLAAVGLWTLATFKEKKMSLRLYICLTTLGTVLAISTVEQLWVNYLTRFSEDRSYSLRWTASPMLSILKINSLSFETAFVVCAVISLFVFCIIYLFSTSEKQTGLCFALFALAVIMGIVGVNSAKDYALGKDSSKLKSVDEVRIIVDSVPTQNVYWINKDFVSTSGDSKILQWELGDRPIKFCDIEDISKTDTSDSLYLSDSDRSDISENLLEEYEKIYDSGTISLWCGESNCEIERIKDLGTKASDYVVPNKSKINLSNITTEASYIKINGSLYQNWDYTEAYLTGGMKVLLDKGHYEFYITLEAEEIEPSDCIGYFSVGTVEGENTNIQRTEVLNGNVAQNGKQTFTLSLDIDDEAEPFVGLYTYGNSAIRVYDISYSKISNNYGSAK